MSKMPDDQPDPEDMLFVLQNIQGNIKPRIDNKPHTREQMEHHLHCIRAMVNSVLGTQPKEE